MPSSRLTTGPTTRRRLLGTTLATGGAAFLAACGGKSATNGARTAATSVAPSGASAPAAAGSAAAAVTSAARSVDGSKLTLTAAISNDTGSADPGTVAGVAGGSWPTSSPLFDSLVQVNDDTLKYAPALASSWEVMPDGSAWTFKLRPGVTFHNGDVFTAQDAKFTIERQIGRAAYNPAFKAGDGPVWMRLVDSIETPDAGTVVFKMKVADATALVRFSSERIVPMKYLAQAGDDGFEAKPVGTGPYQLQERKVNESITLKAFPGYFGKDAPAGSRPAARIGTVVQKVIPEDGTRIASLQTGETGLIYQVPPDQVKKLPGKNLDVLFSAVNAPIYIGINWKLEKDPVSGAPNPYRDVRVRQALNYAVNLQEIISKILTGKETPTMMIGTNELGWDPAWKPWPYDPKKAKDLLSAAGYASGLNGRLTVPAGRWPAADDVAQALAGYWAAVGIPTMTQSQEYAAVATQIQQKSIYPFVFFGAAGGIDPAFAFQGLFASTSTFGIHGGDPQVDQLIAKAATIFDEQERAKVDQQIRSIAWDNAWWVPLYENVLGFGIDKSKWRWTPSKGTGVLQYWNVEPV